MKKATTKSTLRISSIEVKNFKSLVDFNLPLAKFSCLIGLNGSGKSTVLQFIDFASRLIRGDIKGWLEERQWKASELKSKFLSKRNIEFCIHFTDVEGNPAGKWQSHFNPSELRCTWERFDTSDVVLETAMNTMWFYKIDDAVGAAAGAEKFQESKVSFNYQGSILSALKEKLLPDSIVESKQLLQGIESLETLAPDSLRSRTRASGGTLGHGGRNLSAYLYELGPSQLKELHRKLSDSYPHLRSLEPKSLRSGWKQFEASEQFNGNTITTESRHLNDGMLRLIAILAEVSSEHELILFDEIENGINPELVEFVIDQLVNASQQVLVTTHSPVILNYLNDQTAQEGVFYLYKTSEGHTRAIRFFDIPSLKKKLTMMGPGEAFVDTNLTQLAKEIAKMTKEDE